MSGAGHEEGAAAVAGAVAIAAATPEGRAPMRWLSILAVLQLSR